MSVRHSRGLRAPGGQQERKRSARRLVQDSATWVQAHDSARKSAPPEAGTPQGGESRPGTSPRRASRTFAGIQRGFGRESRLASKGQLAAGIRGVIGKSPNQLLLWPPYAAVTCRPHRGSALPPCVGPRPDCPHTRSPLVTSALCAAPLQPPVSLPPAWCARLRRPPWMRPRLSRRCACRVASSRARRALRPS